MAATLNLPVDVKTAVSDIIIGNEHRIDIGSFNADKYFTYVASFGAFTKTSYTTPQQLKNTLGHFAYVIEGIREMRNIRPYNMSVKCDNCEIEGDFIFGSVTNSTSIGGIIKLKSPRIDLSDGMFEVVLIRQPQNPIEMNSLIFNISSQNFQNDKNILFIHTSSVNFIVNEPAALPWTIDGEYAGDYDCVKIQNLFKAITILKADN